MGIVRNAIAGVTAGVVGMVAMDMLWYRRYRNEGGDDGFTTWEFGSEVQSFGDDDVPAPAQVGQRVAALVGVDLPDSSVGATNNVVHWATGAGWGKVAGLASAALPFPPLAVGVATGMAAFGTSYAALGAVGIYEPITTYDAKTLWQDLSAHLVFGTAVGVALTVWRRLSA